MFLVNRLFILFILLVMSGCAVDHVHPEFDQRFSGSEKVTGLMVRLESTAFEMGGLKHKRNPKDELLMIVAIRNMQQLFSPQQLQQMKSSLTLLMPAELVALGYEEQKVIEDTTLLANLLKSVISNPNELVQGIELVAVQRLAERSGGDIVLLGDIRIQRHASDESRSFANLLAIIAAAGGQYGITASQDTSSSRWAVIDPVDGKVLRVFEETNKRLY